MIDNLRDLNELNNDDSNDKEPKKVDKKKILLLTLPVFFFIILVIVIKIKYSGSSIQKQEKGYYCENMYSLKGDKCILTASKPVLLLGNINQDGTINQDDVNKLKELLNSNQFDDLVYALSDINADGVVNDDDLIILEEYVNNQNNDYNLSSRTVCAMDSENKSNYMSDNKDSCVQIITKEALKDGDKVNQLEENNQEIISTNRYLGLFNNPAVDEEETGESDNNTENNETDDNNQQTNTSDLNTQTSETPSTTNETIPKNTEQNTTYTPKIPAPNTTYPSTRPNTSYPSVTHNYNTSSYPYTYGYSTSSFYDTNYFNNPFDTLGMGLVDKEQSGKGSFSYVNGSPITIEELSVPSENKLYNRENDLEFELKINQQGTGTYYYTIKTYYGNNLYNGGFMQSVSSCKAVPMKKTIKFNMNMLSNNRYLSLNVYQDKKCREKAIVAKYTSPTYNGDIQYQNNIEEEKTIKVNDKVVISMIVPQTKNKGLYRYKIKYSIADGKDYYAVWREYGNNILVNKSDCNRVINGVNQLFNVDYQNNNHYGELSLYSDSKCKKLIQSNKTN